jgi:hypothetical protein
MGESKVMMPRAELPTTAFTVTNAAVVSADIGLAKHSVLVEDVQATVEHTASDTWTETVLSNAEKSRPVTVIDEAPLAGRFSCAPDPTGPSKEYMLRVSVPQTAATVNVESEDMLETARELRQAVEDVLVHEMVSHIASSLKAPVTVGSMKPNDKPETVREAMPLGGELSLVSETAAASKVNKPRPVPTMPETVTILSASLVLARTKAEV